jgi:nitroreductase
MTTKRMFVTPDVIALMKQRKSTRVFTDKMPPKKEVLECLEAATWAPNKTNLQPWQFIVLEGEKLKAVTNAIEENFAIAFQEAEGLAQPPVTPQTAQILNDRKGLTMQKMDSYFNGVGIDMQSVGAGMFRFFGAPLGVLFATYPAKSLDLYKSTVSAIQNFILAAESKGLATSWLSAVNVCEQYVMDVLDLHQDLILVGAVALGYEDVNSPTNQMPRDRIPVEDVTTWLDK